MMHGQKNIKT